MNWFRNRKIGFRITFGFLIVAFIAGVIGGIGIYSLKKIDSDYTLAYTDSTHALEYVDQIASSFQRVRLNVYGLVLADQKADKDMHRERIDEHRDVVAENIQRYKEILDKYSTEEVAEELRLINAVKTDYEDYCTKTEAMINGIGMDASRYVEAYGMLKQGSSLYALANSVDDDITKLVKYNISYAEDQIANNGNEAAIATITLICCVGLGVVLAVIIGVLISKGISRPIGHLVKAADALALGDVNIEVKAKTQDEVGELIRSIEKMVQNIRTQANIAEQIALGDMTVNVPIRSENDLLGKTLSQMVDGNNEILSNIASASDQVAAGAQQISDSSIALSQGATEQASSVEELTASLEEISAQIKQNAENAGEANKLAEAAKQGASQGNQQMQNMLKAMDEINDASSNISKIIKVIDEIAFQTNILALNAAVEAAHAGQDGKGFAVVAEEVRNLAGRSANAAKETTDMIENSIKKVEYGTRIAKETADALNKIVSASDNVASLVGSIATASNEQAIGVGQINEGIVLVSQVVQTNSATSEESAAASEELSSQAALLKQMVAKFKLKQGVRAVGYFGDSGSDAGRRIEDAKPEDEKISIALEDAKFGKY